MAVLPLITPKLPQVPDRRGQGEDSLVKLFERIQKGEKERRSFRERRATPRVSVEFAVKTNDGGEQLVRTTHDLSTFGMALKGGTTPAAGTRLDIQLFLPDDPAPLELKAEVLGAFGPDGGARLKFISPPIEAVRRIHRFLK